MFLTGISWKVYDVNRFINVIVLMEILYPMYYNLIKYIIKFERYESTQNILPWKKNQNSWEQSIKGSILCFRTENFT